MSALRDAAKEVGIETRLFVARNAADMAQPLPPVPYICKGLGLARSSAPNCVGGYGFSRKTMALQDMALAVATGTKAWERFDCTRANVVHVDYEQGGYLTDLRYQRLALQRGIDLAALGESLRCVSPGKGIYLDDERAERGLVDLVRENSAGLLIVDSLKAATPTLEENSSAIRIPLDTLMRVSCETDCSVVVIHHARKPAKEDAGGDKAVLRGSSAIFDACSSVLVFASDDGEPTRISQPKNRWTGRGVEPCYLDTADTDGIPGEGPLRCFVTDVADDPQWMIAMRAKVLEFVTAHPGRSRKDVLASFSGQAKRKTATIDQMVEDGIIVAERGKGISLATALPFY